MISSTTAFSTQPPETDPAIAWSGAASSRAFRSRRRAPDAGHHRAADRPVRLHSFVFGEQFTHERTSGLSVARAPPAPAAQLFERGDRGEGRLIHVRQRGLEAGHRFEAGPARERVEPVETIARSAKPSHLRAEERGVAPLPPVRSMSTMAPLRIVRRTQRRLSSRRLSPIRVPPFQSSTVCPPGEGGIRIAERQLAGDPGESGAEDEDLDRRAGRSSAWAKRSISRL